MQEESLTLTKDTLSAAQPHAELLPKPSAKPSNGENGDQSTAVIKQQNNFQGQIEALIPTCGTLQLTEEQKKILYAPPNEEDIEIRPDGLVYLPWMEYAERLKKVFGIEWALIPNQMPKIYEGYMVWGFYLIIKGRLMAFALGEQEYHLGYRRMTYTDASESAKSNALMRCCKNIGITLELWKPSFIRQWKEKYAEEYWDEKKNKYLWKLKNQFQNQDREFQPQKNKNREFQPQKNKSLKDHNPTKEEQFKYIQDAILTMATGDVEIAKQFLQSLSYYKFTNKEGKEIESYFTSLEELQKAKDKRTAVIYSKTKEKYEKYLNSINAGEKFEFEDKPIDTTPVDW